MGTNVLHPCEIIYELSDKPVYGTEKGICRITGKEAIGLPFEKWVSDTFTNWDLLFEGDIISNAAIFCFDDTNEFLRKKLGRSERTRFRNYSHFVVENEWCVFTKSQKKEMYQLLVEKVPIIAVISDSGQKHLLFRYRYGYWQFEEDFLEPNKKELRLLKETMDKMLKLGFSKGEIQTGSYSQSRIQRASLVVWQEYEELLKQYRNTKIFEFALWFSQKIEEN